MVAVSHSGAEKDNGRESVDEGDLSLGAKALIVDEPLESVVVDVGDGVPKIHGEARVVDWSRKGAGVEVVLGTVGFSLKTLLLFLLARFRSSQSLPSK